MRSTFFQSVVAGAAANLVVTRGLNINAMDPIERQGTAFMIAAVGFLYGVTQRNSAAIGFAVGMAATAAGQCAFHLLAVEPKASRL